MQVQEIISGFGSEFTLMSSFGTMEMCSYLGLFPDPHELIFINNLMIKARRNVFDSLNLLRYISLRWDVVSPLLDNMNT